MPQAPRKTAETISGKTLFKLN